MVSSGILSCIVCTGILEGRKKKFCSSECEKIEGRRTHVLKTYGITLEEYDKILEVQGGVCALCKRPPPSGQHLHIDHQHEQGKSGRLNGLLDMRCNKFIKGNLTVAQVEALYEYMMNPPAVVALGREVWSEGPPKRKRQPRKRTRNVTTRTRRV